MKANINKYIYLVIIALAGVGITSCDKVSPTGVLIGNTGTNDRVEMSVTYYQHYLDEYLDGFADDEYSFIVGSDSHVATDTCRMAELMQDALDNEDEFIAVLGDIADTKAEYYIHLSNTIDTFKEKYIEKYLRYNPETDKYTDIRDGVEGKYEDIVYPFFPVVGNHDITHNGWALFSSLFHSSFYEFTIKVGDTDQYDHFIFLDSANGTLGSYQVDLLENETFVNLHKNIRHRFVFTHTNFFRPSSNQFAGTYPREELYYLFNKFTEWNTTIVFAGHVHKWDDREFGGVRYLTLDSMSERNSPESGEYLVRVTCHRDGTVDYEKVKMNYTPNK